MKNGSSSITVLLLTFLLWAVTLRLDKITAIQKLQLAGYDHIMDTGSLRYGAWWRSNCTFPEYSRFSFYSLRPDSRSEYISVCVGLWGEPTIRIP